MKLHLLEKEMDRREFLGHIGSLLLIILGLSGVVRFLVHGGLSEQRQRSGGYGTSAYGGARRGLF